MAIADDSSNRSRIEKGLNQHRNDALENFDRLIMAILFLGTILVCVVLMYLHSNT